MIPVTINLPDALSGDTWEGLSIGPVLFNGVQPPAALVSCRLYFRTTPNKRLAHGFKSVAATGFGLITITNAATWMVNIPAQTLPLTAGVYVWDFETTDAAGIVRTLYKGTQKIIQDSTHD